MLIMGTLILFHVQSEDNTVIVHLLHALLNVDCMFHTLVNLLGGAGCVLGWSENINFL
jgi:hypothetical protein